MRMELFCAEVERLATRLGHLTSSARSIRDYIDASTSGTICGVVTGATHHLPRGRSLRFADMADARCSAALTNGGAVFITCDEKHQETGQHIVETRHYVEIMIVRTDPSSVGQKLEVIAYPRGTEAVLAQDRPVISRLTMWAAIPLPKRHQGPAAKNTASPGTGGG